MTTRATERATNDVGKAVKHFNLARRDGKWGAPSLMHMIELYLNPDNETMWDDQETEESAEALTSKVSEAVSSDGLLSLTDSKGRVVLVPGAKIAYVELGSTTVAAVGFRS